VVYSAAPVITIGIVGVADPCSGSAQPFQLVTARGAPFQMLLQRDALLALKSSSRQQGEIVGELFVQSQSWPPIGYAKAE